jgi:uncharacterized damage-inducible protein DinB
MMTEMAKGATIGAVRRTRAAIERLLRREPVTDWADFRQQSLPDLFAIGDEARRMIDQYMASADEASLSGTMTFSTLTEGTITATRRKILVNVVTHGMRHWAQVTTFVRQGGVRASWPHDLLGVEVGM